MVGVGNSDACDTLLLLLMLMLNAGADVNDMMIADDFNDMVIFYYRIHWQRQHCS
jgi:hypothetical protein